MIPQNRRSSRFLACLLIVVAVGLFLFLSLRFDIVKPKQSLMEVLLHELEESLEEIAINSKVPKVGNSNDVKCLSTDADLQQPRCPPGIRAGCMQEYMLKDLRHRLEDLMHNEHLRIAPQYRMVLQYLEKQIKGYYHLVIVHGLSSDNYLESRAMLKDVKEKIFPLVPDIKLVVYDLGLSQQEKKEYQKLCRCHLIEFPFGKLPSFCRTLECFCWKPFILRAHLANGDLVMWMDASFRYTFPRDQSFLDTLKYGQMYGLQRDRVGDQPEMPTRALPTVFHHYGFKPCAFKQYRVTTSSWAMYRNSPLIEHAVLDIWTACALNYTCSCLGPDEDCPPITGNSHRPYVGQCHKSQTAEAIVVARLWMEHYNTVGAIQEPPQHRGVRKLDV